MGKTAELSDQDVALLMVERFISIAAAELLEADLSERVDVIGGGLLSKATLALMAGQLRMAKRSCATIGQRSKPWRPQKGNGPKKEGYLTKNVGNFPRGGEVSTTVARLNPQQGWK